MESRPISLGVVLLGFFIELSTIWKTNELSVPSNWNSKNSKWMASVGFHFQNSKVRALKASQISMGEHWEQFKSFAVYVWYSNFILPALYDVMKGLFNNVQNPIIAQKRRRCKNSNCLYFLHGKRRLTVQWLKWQSEHRMPATSRIDLDSININESMHAMWTFKAIILCHICHPK